MGDWVVMDVVGARPIECNDDTSLCTALVNFSFIFYFYYTLISAKSQISSVNREIYLVELKKLFRGTKKPGPGFRLEKIYKKV